MTKIADIQDTRILAGLNPLANLSERPRMGVGYTLTSCRATVGQQKGIARVAESLWQSAEDGQKILNRLCRTLLIEQENHFKSYWRHVFAQQYNESTGGKHLCSCL